LENVCIMWTCTFLKCQLWENISLFLWKLINLGKLGTPQKLDDWWWPGEMGRLEEVGQWMDQESWIMLWGRIMGQFGRIWPMDEFKKVQFKENWTLDECLQNFWIIIFTLPWIARQCMCIICYVSQESKTKAKNGARFKDEIPNSIFIHCSTFQKLKCLTYFSKLKCVNSISIVAWVWDKYSPLRECWWHTGDIFIHKCS
jgi:hypothetical protein